MAHGCIWSSTMPVPRTRWDYNHITGVNHALFSINGHNPFALCNVEYLPLFMDMRTCASSRVEVDHENSMPVCLSRVEELLDTRLSLHIRAEFGVFLSLGL